MAITSSLNYHDQTMCNRYTAPEDEAIERYWRITGRNRLRWEKNLVFPHAPGPFIRRARHDAGYSRELVVGQWGLIPWFAKAAKLSYATNNARSEELASKDSYKQPLARGQRCVIPVLDFDEPCWETGKNVWWRFRRADGQLCGLAGLWNTWTDKDTGEVHESYTMLTINADHHPLMSRMHKPDPKLAPDQQDKRSVIPIELEDVDTWLAGSSTEAAKFLRPPADDVFMAEPQIEPRR